MNKIYAILISFIILTFNPVSVYANTYYSELTGLPIDESIKDIRPIAVMIDNEQKALPHSSAAEADIVYEMMNSMANGRITRLMCLYKDYASLDQIGSIRSVRTTHIPIAAEYNAILIHEGGPELYVSVPLKQSWIDDINGGFSRLQNNKAREFTEFIVKGEVAARAKQAGISLQYGKHKPYRDLHFNFEENKDIKSGKSAILIDMSGAYPHTGSKLTYNSQTKSYDFYTYDEMQKDYNTGKSMSFKNVILQITPVFQLDENGYMAYSIIGTGEGYYCSEGNVIPCIWKKASATDMTKYFDVSTGAELCINPGKTYINIYPKEYINQLIIK